MSGETLQSGRDDSEKPEERMSGACCLEGRDGLLPTGAEEGGFGTGPHVGGPRQIYSMRYTRAAVSCMSFRRSVSDSSLKVSLINSCE